jgi:hypothetical protein
MDVTPDTISYNALLDSWARSGERMAPNRAEQIVNHMHELAKAGNNSVRPDTFTYNTLINCIAKAGERGGGERAEHVLMEMERRYREGNKELKPNTRTYTSVIDALSKSRESGAARRAEHILMSMHMKYQKTGDPDVKPNVHTSNAVCNVRAAHDATPFVYVSQACFSSPCASFVQACAFTKIESDRIEALQIAFRVFDWIRAQPDLQADAYTYTIMLSVCANLLPRDDLRNRYAHAKALFDKCRMEGYVNDFVLRKLRQTVTDEEYFSLVGYHGDGSVESMPSEWTRNTRSSQGRSGRSNVSWSRSTSQVST